MNGGEYSGGLAVNSGSFTDPLIPPPPGRLSRGTGRSWRRGRSLGRQVAGCRSSSATPPAGWMVLETFPSHTVKPAPICGYSICCALLRQDISTTETPSAWAMMEIRTFSPIELDWAVGPCSPCQAWKTPVRHHHTDNLRNSLASFSRRRSSGYRGAVILSWSQTPTLNAHVAGSLARFAALH
jgi:hypothetical protein